MKSGLQLKHCGSIKIHCLPLSNRLLEQLERIYFVASGYFFVLMKWAFFFSELNHS